MYIPNSFREDNRDTLHAFMRQYSFATLVTGGEEPFVTHLPMLLDSDRGVNGTLVGHFARPNRHWQLDHGRRQSVAIFQGPHGYISPSWYRTVSAHVPTWNYATVHAVGRLTIVHDRERTAALLERMVKAYEADKAQPWINPFPEETDELVAAVVAFDMEIERLDGKFKLGQNRKQEDQIGTIESLEAAGDFESVELAKLARKQLGIPKE